jgi:hypothetical protein
LAGHGYDASNLEGGLEAWASQGYPLTSPEGSLGRIIDGWARALGALRARFEVTRVEPGSLPRAEPKTRIVYRTARGDELPPAIHALRRETLHDRI